MDALSPEHESRLKSEDWLAEAYLAKGETDKAIELLEEVVRTRMTTLEPDHLDRQISKDLLAKALRQREHGQQGTSRPPGVPVMQVQDQAERALPEQAA